MNDATKVSVGKPKIGGAFFRAEAGTAVPTSALTPLSDDFKNLGYISDDGVTNTQERSTEEIKAWGGDIVLNPQTEKKDSWKVTFIETLNLDVLKTVYGKDNVEGSLDTEIVVKSNALELDYAAWVLDTILTGSILHRVCIPNGKVTEIGDIVYKDNEPIGFEATIVAYPDANGNSHYDYYSTDEESN